MSVIPTYGYLYIVQELLIQGTVMDQVTFIHLQLEWRIYASCVARYDILSLTRNTVHAFLAHICRFIAAQPVALHACMYICDCRQLLAGLTGGFFAYLIKQLCKSCALSCDRYTGAGDWSQHNLFNNLPTLSLSTTYRIYSVTPPSINCLR